MIRKLLCAIALTTCAAAIAATPEQTAALAGLPNVAFPAPHRIASGRLQASDMTALKQAGIGEVIDLSVDSETPDFDEAAAMHDAGIRYRNLPIHGPQDLTRANVAQFNQWLIDAGDRPTLVHCASSNRVGAMMALRASLIDGLPVDAAMTEGRRWGLKSLQPAVRERLDDWATR